MAKRDEPKSDAGEQPVTDARIYAEEFEQLAREGVPYVGLLDFRVERWQAGEVGVRLPHSDLISRPGGTVCGPAMMALADVALYGLVMSLLGRVELAVTTDLGFHFLAKPDAADLIAEARLLKLGRRLLVGEVTIRSEGRPDPVCHAIGSYAIPPTVD
jgi:uncharacterized protein (TIGR00369 family)